MKPFKGESLEGFGELAPANVCMRGRLWPGMHITSINHQIEGMKASYQSEASGEKSDKIGKENEMKERDLKHILLCD